MWLEFLNIISKSADDAQLGLAERPSVWILQTGNWSDSPESETSLTFQAFKRYKSPWDNYLNYHRTSNGYAISQELGPSNTLQVPPFLMSS